MFRGLFGAFSIRLPVWPVGTSTSADDRLISASAAAQVQGSRNRRQDVDAGRCASEDLREQFAAPMRSWFAVIGQPPSISSHLSNNAVPTFTKNRRIRPDQREQVTEQATSR